MEDKVFNNKTILVSSRKNEERMSSSIVALDKNGFLVKGRYNSDAFLQIANNSSINFVFGAFRSDCEVNHVKFDGYVPIFIDLGVTRQSYSEVVSGDIDINGMRSSVIYIVTGNTYKIRYPKSFGKISHKTNPQVHIIQNLESENYFSYDVYSSSSESIRIDIRFESLSLVSLKLVCVSPRSSSSIGTLKHYLNFYEFSVESDRWFLSCPKFVELSYAKKSEYSYYKSSGDSDCFYANGFDTPVMVFDYDVPYVIKNKYKKERPFYFDRKPEGMFKFPYQDFDNDINTDRINLFIVFKGTIDQSSIDYAAQAEDPYFDFSTTLAPAYDPDSIYYAASNRPYFGNRVLIGKRRISEINGMYGRYSPESNKILFSNTGYHLVYDVFHHVSGRVLPVDVVNISSKIVNSYSDISNLNITNKESVYVDKKEDVSYVRLVGDIFENIGLLGESVFNKTTPEYHTRSGSVILVIDEKNVSLDISDRESFSYYYNLIANKNSDINNDLTLFFTNIKDMFKRLGAFEVYVEFM